MRISICLMFALCLCAAVRAAAPADYAPLKAPEARMQEWNEWKFGLFIHWGAWSQSARGRIWDIMRELTPSERAAAFDYYKTFNPLQYDPAEWARAAKDAGMRYVVFVTKHHDGFCNYDTRETDLKITNPQCPYSQTPHPDVTAELVKAFRAEGIKVGLYFSHIDWHHPDGVWWSRHIDYDPDFVKGQPQRWANWVKFQSAQVEELMRRFAPVDIVWFDISWPQAGLRDAIPMLQMMREINPGVILTNRGTSEYGDFQTPEQRIPEEGIPGYWETCMTVTNESGFWYKGEQVSVKPADELVRKLADIASKGGNFLLNVGPRPDGTLMDAEAESLRGVGQWMDTYGEAIYGTKRSPWGAAPEWGRITVKGQRVFAIVLDPPAGGGTISLELPNEIGRAVWMDDGAEAKYERKGGAVEFAVPKAKAESFAPVLAVEFEGELNVEARPAVKAAAQSRKPKAVKPAADGSFALAPSSAGIAGSKLRFQADRGNLGGWTSEADYAFFELRGAKAGVYSVRFTYGCADAHAGQPFVIETGEGRLEATTEGTGGIREYKTFDIGSISLPSGDSTLMVKPNDTLKYPLMNYRLIELMPAP